MAKGALLLAWAVLLAMPMLLLAGFMLVLLLPLAALQAVERWVDRVVNRLWAGW